MQALIQLSSAPQSLDVGKAVAILRRQLKIESDNDIKVLNTLAAVSNARPGDHY